MLRKRREKQQLWEILLALPCGLYLHPKWTKEQIGRANLHGTQQAKRLNQDNPFRREMELMALRIKHHRRTYPRHAR